jgi:hypothetical protein
MDGDDGIAGVVVAGKQGFGFQAIDERGERIDFAAQVGFDILAFAGQIEVGGDVPVRPTVGLVASISLRGAPRITC